MAKKKKDKDEVKTRSWSALGLQHKRNQAFVNRKKKRNKRACRNFRY